MSKVRPPLLKQHAVQNPAGNANHAFPHATHMRRVGRVEYPGAALCVQVLFHTVEAWISLVHLQLTRGANEVSSAVGADLLCGAPDCKKPSQGVDEAARTHCFYYLDVNCP